MTDQAVSVGFAPRALLAGAAVAVGFAAADTYVVVLALPDMMASVGLNVDQLQRAAPIVSGFLLGYIAMLPLIGRMADLRGRLPVLVGSLLVFSVGSLVTAASYDLTTMVTGRFLQGVGGGGLVPATLALVADVWPAERRGLPLGVVGAVQELGSVVGPLYGAAVLSFSTWRTIFWINLAVGLMLVAALVTLGRSAPILDTLRRRSGRGRFDTVGGLLAGLALATLALVMTAPAHLTSGLTTGLAYIPIVGASRWTTPLAVALYLLCAVFVARELTARRPLLNLRGTPSLAAAVDLPGAALLAVTLAGVVLAFATADPRVQVVSPAGECFLLVAAVGGVAFGWQQRRAGEPLVPAGALASRPAWGSLVVSFLVGSALIAALVDIPIFARLTIYPDSQLMAALVLVRLLAALPVGAVLGGYLTRHLPLGLLAGGGLLVAGAAFVWMTQWDRVTLRDPLASVPLVLGGLGFGLAIAPVNAALLGATRSTVRGVASALVVVSRMVGMLVGISVLTAVGLRRFYAVTAHLPTITQLCAADRVCPAYTAALKDAGVAQVHAIFWGAAACALAAAAAAALLLRGSARVEAGGIAGPGEEQTP